MTPLLRHRTWSFAALTALVALAGCSEPPPEEAMKLPPVTATEVVVRNVEDRIEATGELIAQEDAEIAAEVSGRITELVLDEGSDAEQGAVVLEIDPERRKLDLDAAAAQLAEGEAALREQEREVRRIKQLREKNVASRAKLEQTQTAAQTARARVAAARARLELAERALRDASVTAPFTGQVSRRRVSRGEFVNQGQPLFDLVSVSPIEVEFFLAEIDSGRVALGQRVDVRVAPFPDEVFEGIVTVISPTIDSRTRTLRVRAQLPNSDGRLRPGLFARVDLGVKLRENVLLIPEEAVLQRADGAVVFTVSEDNTVERRVIRTGPRAGGVVEVVEGLEPGDSVITRGHSELPDGVHVSIRNPDGSPRRPSVATGPAEHGS